MHEITTMLKMDQLGRITIPKSYRDELGLEPGKMVKVIISNPYKEV